MPHILITETVLSDRRLPLPGRVVVLGRSLEVDVPVPHRSVSRQHALIEKGATGYTLSDLGSSNGTFLEDRRLASGERVSLPVGTPFRLGEVTLRLAPDEVVGEPVRAPEERTLAGTEVAAVAPSPAPAAAVAVAAPVRARSGPPSGRGTPRWRERRQSMRWATVAATAALLAVAGIFVAKIMKNASPKSPPAANRPATGTAGEKKKPEGLKELTLPPK